MSNRQQNSGERELESLLLPAAGPQHGLHLLDPIPLDSPWTQLLGIRRGVLSLSLFLIFIYLAASDRSCSMRDSCVMQDLLLWRMGLVAL